MNASSTPPAPLLLPLPPLLPPRDAEQGCDPAAAAMAAVSVPPRPPSDARPKEEREDAPDPSLLFSLLYSSTSCSTHALSESASFALCAVSDGATATASPAGDVRPDEALWPMVCARSPHTRASSLVCQWLMESDALELYLYLSSQSRYLCSTS